MKANRYILIVILFFSIAYSSLNAQSSHASINNEGYYALSSYVIPVQTEAAYIGKVVPPIPIGKLKVKLLKDTARIFVVRNQELYLKKNKQLTKSSSMTYGIDLLINGVLISFELIKDDFAKNKVIAHRGAWKNTGAAQNSVRSFIEACKLGCRGSEFDVWLSKDNIPVLSHDPVIGGVSVEEATCNRLTNIKLPSGDMVPNLSDFIQVGKQQNTTYLILEIKPSQKGVERSLQLTDSVVAMVHRMKAQGWVEYISFSYEVLQRIHHLDKAAKISYLEGNRSVEDIHKDHLTGIDFSYYYYRSKPQLIEEARQLGLSTNVWTVDAEEDLNLYYHSNMDYITTNEPELLLNIEKK